MSSWDAPGVLFGKPARDCTPDEVAREVWAQMKSHVNKPGHVSKLTDEALLSWQIDPGVLVRGDRLISQDALVQAVVGTEQYRPDPVTAIPNLVLCGDYLNGSWEVANMEATNFNGRRAANAILDQSGSHETPATIIPPYQPPEWEPPRQIDEQLWRQGQPNLFDVDPAVVDVRGLLRRFDPFS
jgi:flavin-dependent amine oxidoreductase